jgi:hypothetical protein
VRRAKTALVARFAVLALAAAADEFDAPDGPDVEGDWQPTTFTEAHSPEGVPPEQPVRTSDAPSAPTGEEGGSSVASQPDGTVASGAGGVSPLFGAIFVGGLLASGLLALALTGDDERASDPGGGDGPPDDPRPTVAVRYGPPPDGPADRAADAGISRRASERLADCFRAVRYGDEAPDPERERAVRGAVAELDGRDAEES